MFSLLFSIIGMYFLMWVFIIVGCVLYKVYLDAAATTKQIWGWLAKLVRA